MKRFLLLLPVIWCFLFPSAVPVSASEGEYLRVIGEDTFNVRVTVEGARSVIFNLNPEDIDIRPAFSEIQGAGKSEISLTATKAKAGSYTITAVSPATISLNCDYWITATVPLTTDIGAVSVKDEKLFALIKETVAAFAFAGPIDMDVFCVDGKFYISEINPRFGGGYPHAYECGVRFPEYIANNVAGKENPVTIGTYEEGAVMLKYTDLMIL